MTREKQIVEIVLQLLDKGQPFGPKDVVFRHRAIRDSRGWKELPGHRPEQMVRPVLRSLEALEVLKSDDGRGSFFAGDRYDRFRAERDDKKDPPEHEVEGSQSSSRDGERTGGGGGGDRSVPPGGGSDDGDGVGRGYREVLSHPHLFSLPSDDFELLLNSIGEPC